MYHFADDTNLLYSNSSLKLVNKYINHDLKLLVHWLRANRISLNVSKTEIVLFRPKNKKINKKLNYRLSGEKIIPTTHTRYLGIIIDQHFTWDQHLKMLKKKFSRANGLLAKARYYLYPNLLRTRYFAIFESHLRYGCQIWGQQRNQHITDVNDLHRKALRIINFKGKYSPWKPLFKESKIMTFPDILRSGNFLLVLKQINQTLPTNLRNMFKFSEPTYS